VGPSTGLFDVGGQRLVTSPIWGAGGRAEGDRRAGDGGGPGSWRGATNTVGHWAIAAPDPASRLLTWSTLTIATTIIGLLAVLTVRMVWRASR
jgi:hypothetical protein